ncbi:hypothetical protein ACB094_11G188900 [Castanea mollissima]
MLFVCSLLHKCLSIFCFFFTLFGECASSMSPAVRVSELWTLRIRPKDSAVHV